MQINRMNIYEQGKLRAFFDLEIEGLTIKGFKIMEAITGLFVSMPSQKNDKGEWNDTIFATKEARKKLNDIAIARYNEEKQPKRMSGGMSEVDRVNNSTSYDDKDEQIPF